MMFALARRMLAEPAPRLLARFLFAFAWKGRRAMAAFRRRTARGERSPAVLFVSVTDRCNLACRGCWVTPCRPSRDLAPERLQAVFAEWKRKNRGFFFGLLGGEPLLYPHLESILAAHPDCYFQVFTNGLLLNDARAAAFRRLGNVTPVISIEGDAEVSDQRRGAPGVLHRSLAALDACRRQRLLFGVATSLCKNNWRAHTRGEFVEAMVRRGALYLWYYLYRPAGPDPAPELALDEDEILAVRRFLVEARSRFPILIVDAYWDAEGRALCPAAEGISHHIGPGGDLEPCPPIQFACENLADGEDLNALFRNSTFLERFRQRAAAEGRGCILLSNPSALRDVVQASGARDTSGRGTALRELAAMPRRPCHDLPGREIPERHWFYRLAKRRWFFGFGTYG